MNNRKQLEEKLKKAISDESKRMNALPSGQEVLKQLRNMVQDGGIETVLPPKEPTKDFGKQFSLARFLMDVKRMKQSSKDSILPLITPEACAILRERLDNRKKVLKTLSTQGSAFQTGRGKFAYEGMKQSAEKMRKELTMEIRMLEKILEQAEKVNDNKNEEKAKT
jgi:hypothetical protein